MPTPVTSHSVSSAARGLYTSWITTQKVFSGNLGIAILFAVTSYSGFEVTAVFREEARGSEQTIPRATFGASADSGHVPGSVPRTPCRSPQRIRPALRCDVRKISWIRWTGLDPRKRRVPCLIGALMVFQCRSVRRLRRALGGRRSRIAAAARPDSSRS